MKSESTIGFQAALLSLTMWGLLPIYWKFLHHVPALEILSHRVFWSMVFVYIILITQGRKAELSAAIHSRRTVAYMAVSSFLIGCNWFVYIWAVNHEKVLETSMGYFISPMFNILFGYLFLREKVRGLMIPAVCIVLAAIFYLAFVYGHIPYAGLSLAVTFSLYGLVRKKAAVKPLPGLFLETIMLTPLALGYLITLGVNGTGVFLVSMSDSLMLAGGGIATSLPLLLYVAGANRLRLGTLGTLQYISPTIAFMLGAFLYGEPLGRSMLVTFILIWFGVFLYLGQLFRDSRKMA